MDVTVDAIRQPLLIAAPPGLGDCLQVRIRGTWMSPRDLKFGQKLVLWGLFVTSCLLLSPAAAFPEDRDVVDAALLGHLQERLERLEADNQSLRSRLQLLERGKLPPAVAEEAERLFQENESPPVVSEEQVRAIVAEMSPIASPNDSNVVTGQEDRLISLERAFHDLLQRSGEKVYPTVALTGVFQADAGWFSQSEASRSDYGPLSDGVDFRRFRLAAKGSIREDINYFAQVDFGAFGRPAITDLYVERTNLPFVGNFRVGQWKQPFSLEVVSSFRYTTFMERSVLFQSFTPFRHLGVGIYDHSEDLNSTYAASIFAAGQDQFGGSISLSGGYATAERVTHLLQYDCDGREYLHVGLGHYFSVPNNHIVNFRTLPEAFVGVNPADSGTSGQGIAGVHNGTPFFVATGNLSVDCFNVIGTELLWVRDRFSLQSETMINFVNARTHSGSATYVPTQEGTAVLPGAYVQIGWFLTDDYRPYDRKSGAIDRVIPRRSLTFCRGNCDPGWGAWEIAARFSYLNLTDKSGGTLINGGWITDYTLGLNWYTTPYTKVVFNYIHSVADPGTLSGSNNPGTILNTIRSDTNIFMTRMQVDF